MRAVLAFLAVVVIVTPALAADDTNPAWAALVTGGHVALIRHGNAPPGYGGDPPGYRLDDCTTQRNLDDKGREQARALGEEFRKRGVRVEKILVSPFCRCIETGELMAVGPVEKSMALLPDFGPSPVRFLALKDIVSAWQGPGTLVLVTHALTIRPFVGFLPNQADAIVLQPSRTNPRGGDFVGKITPEGKP